MRIRAPDSLFGNPGLARIRTEGEPRLETNQPLYVSEGARIHQASCVYFPGPDRGYAIAWIFCLIDNMFRGP